MDINRFKKTGRGIDQRTWDTWLDDDVRPAGHAVSNSATIKPIRAKVQNTSTAAAVSKKPTLAKPKAVVKAPADVSVTPPPKNSVVPLSSRSSMRRADYQRRYAEGRGILDASPSIDEDITRIAKSHKSKPKGAAVSVNIQLPQLPKFHVAEWRKLPWQAFRPWAFALGAIALVILGSSVYSWWQNGHRAPAKVQTVSATKDMGYKPYTPAGKTVATFGQYDAKKKLYTFNDAYMGSKLTINQQTMPDKLKDSKEELQKLIDSVGAAESFTTSKGEVYVATDLATGSQRLVVVGTNLLVFIQSTTTLENASWVKYLSTLQ